MSASEKGGAMIEKVESIPPIYATENPNRAFAEKCLEEFVAADIDMARVRDLPKGVTVEQMANHIRSAIGRARLRDEVSITTRKQDIYLARTGDGKE